MELKYLDSYTFRLRNVDFMLEADNAVRFIHDRLARAGEQYGRAVESLASLHSHSQKRRQELETKGSISQASQERRRVLCTNYSAAMVAFHLYSNEASRCAEVINRRLAHLAAEAMLLPDEHCRQVCRLNLVLCARLIKDLPSELQALQEKHNRRRDDLPDREEVAVVRAEGADHLYCMWKGVQSAPTDGSCHLYELYCLPDLPIMIGVDAQFFSAQMEQDLEALQSRIRSGKAAAARLAECTADLAQHYQMWDSYIKSRNPDDIPDLIETMSRIMLNREGARLQAANERRELATIWTSCKNAWRSCFDCLDFRVSILPPWQRNAVYLQLTAIRRQLILAARLDAALQEATETPAANNAHMQAEIEQAAQLAIEKIQDPWIG